MPSGPGSLLLAVADRATDVDEVMAAVTEAVRAWVGVGPVFVATADPVSGSFSRMYTYDVPPDAASAFAQLEASGRDVCTFASIARSGTGVAALYAATDGRPERSDRWRDVISPLQWGDEMRAAVRAHGRIWGYLCLHREQHDLAFTGRETERLAALLPAVAAAMRTTMTAIRPDGDDLGTGVVLADGNGRVIGTSGAAAQWLDEIAQQGMSAVPLVLQDICRRAANGETVTASITTRTGRVAVVEAAGVQSSGDTDVAMVIRAAPAKEALPRFALATGLTPRESDVVSCVLRGLSTREIADELSISVYTVQAHLTSVFGKSKVNSRRELTSLLR